MNKGCSITMLLGRVAISAIFIFAGLNKFMDFQGNEAYMASKNLPAIPFLLIAAALIEILGGLSVFLGYKARYGALLLALFLIPVNYFFHDFWNIADPVDMQEQMIHFFANTAIFGGLLYVFSCGAGSLSIDRETC